MSRIVRQTLFSLLIAYHASLSLCGPCLHGFQASAHDQFGDVSKSDRSDHPTLPQSDSKHGCLVCHFFAQVQLPAEYFSAPSPLNFSELAFVDRPISESGVSSLASLPRAPPATIFELS
jgi:hypothetical protein